jgi:hypothetical protein
VLPQVCLNKTDFNAYGAVFPLQIGTMHEDYYDATERVDHLSIHEQYHVHYVGQPCGLAIATWGN